MVKKIIKQIKNNKIWFIVLSCLFLTFLYSFVYFNKIKFKNEAWYGGDTWEYQSNGVNLALGHGMKFGAIEDFAKYKFGTGYQWEVTQGSSSDDWFKSAGKSGGVQAYFTTPGYFFFLGTIYKIFGINPIIVKNIQLMMLILVASFLPLLGFLYWKWQGFFSGIISGVILLNQYTRPLSKQFETPGITFPDQVLTETLIMFTIFIVTLLIALWERKTNFLTSAILGLILGLSLLVKGSLSFVPWLFLIFAWFWLKKKNISRKYVFIVMLGIFLVVIPWSVHISKILKKPTFISTQSDLVILSTNNEESLDGSWHSAALNNPSSFYLRSDIKNLPTSLKVILFYFNHKEMIPIVFINKINTAFTYFAYLKVGLVFIVFSLFVSIVIKFKNIFIKRTSIKLSFLILIAILIKTTYFIGVYFRKTDPIFSFILSPAVLLISVFSLYGLYLLIYKKIPTFKVPMSFIVIFLNFFIITLCTLGMARIIQVMDFIFILLGVLYILKVLMVFYSLIIKNKAIFSDIRRYLIER